MSALLEIADLRGGYGETEILRGVSLAVGAGEIVALLGSNGAGKTTLNTVVCGICKAWSGEVRFDGHSIYRGHYVDIVRAGLILVPEGRKVFPNLSVLENLELGAFARGRANLRRNLDSVLSFFPALAGRLKQLAGTLSGGEQQMMAIGRGLMAEPRLLILDEPSLGLSPLLVEEMFSMIQVLRQSNLSILLVEQNVALSLAIANRAYVLENGVIGFEGTSEELMDSDRLRRAYLGV